MDLTENRFNEATIDMKYDSEQRLAEIEARKTQREADRTEARHKRGKRIFGTVALAGAVTASAVAMGHSTLGEGVRSLVTGNVPAAAQSHPNTVPVQDPDGVQTGTISYENATPAQQAEARFNESGRLEP